MAEQPDLHQPVMTIAHQNMVTLHEDYTVQQALDYIRLHARLRSILDHMRELVLSFSYLEDFDKDSIDDLSFLDDHLVEINSSALSFYEVPASYILNKKVSVLDYGRVEYMNPGKVRRVNHIIEDITEKKRALDELQASEQKYRRIFELSKDMIYILKPNGQIIDINPAGIKLLGLSSQEEAKQRNITDFHVDPEARKSLVKEILENGEATKYRILFQNVKGEKFEIGLNAIAQRDDTGKTVSYQEIAHNITEAIRQKELEAISQLAGCFVDDLASPLSVIMMGVEAFTTFLPDVEELTEKLSSQDVRTDLEDTVNEIKSQVSDVNYSLNEVATAVEDVRQRLKEIRDQYWNLRKVSDGSGGIIYQRATKEN